MEKNLSGSRILLTKELDQFWLFKLSYYVHGRLEILKIKDYFGYVQAEDHQRTSAKGFYRQIYFDTQDNAIRSIKPRFDEPGFEI